MAREQTQQKEINQISFRLIVFETSEISNNLAVSIFELPVLKKSNYAQGPWYLFNRHMETVIPSMLFRTRGITYDRERIETSDDDFLDLDWLRNGNKKLLILSHGLEGSSERQYILRPAKYFHERGWDILAWNCRGM